MNKFLNEWILPLTKTQHTMMGTILMCKVLGTLVWILDILFHPPVDIDLNIIQVECIVKVHCFVS